jgi:hypothetical protein
LEVWKDIGREHYDTNALSQTSQFAFRETGIVRAEGPSKKLHNNYIADLSGVVLAKPENEVIGMKVRQ